MSPASPGGGRVAVAVVIAAGVLTAAVIAAVALVAGSDPTGAVERFEIPAGTAARLDRGEEVEILPGRMEVRVGDAVEIVNNDERDALVGPFLVPAGETLVHTFRATGTIEAYCSLHPSGQLIIDVLP